jgi:site-specific DNA recombinase
VHLRRAGKEVRMVLDHTDPFAPPPKPDRTLIRLVIRAHRFHDMLIAQKGGKFGDLAKSAKLNRSYFSRLLRLAYLAPDITTAIFDGDQPAGLTATTLTERADLPMSWREQRRTLGFA